MQAVSKSPQRVTGGGRAGIGINLHHTARSACPDSHDHPRMYIQVDEQVARMPRIMDCDRTYSGGLAARSELPVERARINWGA